MLIAVLCSVLVLGGVFYGCGKKADPRPSGSAPPKAISDLKASLADYGVVLRWTIPDAKGGIQKYRIERSELRAKGATCPDCPLQYAVVADLSSNDPKLAREGENTVLYLDAGIKAGYLYYVSYCNMRFVGSLQPGLEYRGSCGQPWFSAGK